MKYKGIKNFTKDDILVNSYIMIETIDIPITRGIFKVKSIENVGNNIAIYVYGNDSYFYFEDVKMAKCEAINDNKYVNSLSKDLFNSDGDLLDDVLHEIISNMEYSSDFAYFKGSYGSYYEPPESAEVDGQLRGKLSLIRLKEKYPDITDDDLEQIDLSLSNFIYDNDNIKSYIKDIVNENLPNEVKATSIDISMSIDYQKERIVLEAVVDDFIEDYYDPYEY